MDKMSSNIQRKLRTPHRAAGKDKSNIKDKDKGQRANIWKLLCKSEDSNTGTSVSSLEYLNNNVPGIRTQMSLIIWDCNSPLGKNLFQHNDSPKITGTGINTITWSHRGTALQTLTVMTDPLLSECPQNEIGNAGQTDTKSFSK